jgi:hypothetical protein
MEEKIIEDKGIKKLETISKALLIIFPLFVLYVSFVRPEQEFYCFGTQVNLLILLSPLILAIILEIIALSIRSEHHLSTKDSIKSFSKFLVYSLVFSLVISIFFVSCCGSRNRAIDARKMGNLKAIYDAQKRFYIDNSKYASLEELKERRYLSGYITDEIKVYNIDFEGDSDYWKAQTDIKEYEHELCSLKKIKKIYLCNEKGCSEEIVEIQK